MTIALRHSGTQSPGRHLRLARRVARGIMRRVVSYIRISTGKQDKSSLGIKAERAAISRFAAIEDYEIIGEFVQVETGKGADALDRRPNLAAGASARTMGEGRPSVQVLPSPSAKRACRSEPTRRNPSRHAAVRMRSALSPPALSSRAI
jgi:hypothetical protein